MRTGKTLIVLFIVGLISTVLRADISLTADINNPDPNEEVTIYVHTDTPLFCLGLGAYILGDASIASAMCEADCNQYGWDNGWNSDPYIDPNGYVYLSGVRWASDANGTVGYFKFRYNSGQISIYIDPEWSNAFSYDGSSCSSVPFSTETLLFGQPDTNDSNESGFFSQSEIMDGGELMMDFLSSYDATITGIHKYNTVVVYSDQTILADDSAYLVYDCNSTLVNCVMDVNGSVEFNGDITLINSQIRVKGNLKCKPGIQIGETGASSIRATGDSTQAGKITLVGDLDNPIIVESDNVSNDSEFIVIDANSSSNSSLKCIDFYGGWTNIQIYNKRLNNPISNCCFFGAEYAIWQDGITELTTISFSLFSENDTSIFASIDGTSRTITYPLIDNVVIDGIPSQTWGIVLSGGQSASYFDYFEITNSIITNCYCGWYFDADSVYPPKMLNLAYYNNYYDDNYGHPSFVRNPMYLSQSPFVSYGGWPYFTNPVSPVADVNLGYNIYQDAPEQMLTSIYSDSTPRTNIGLGFGLALPSGYVSHIPSLIQGDFDESGLVNNRDFYVFAADWRSIRGTNPIHYPDINGYSVADFDKGGVVNNFDLAVLAANWLSKDSIELTIDTNDTLLTSVCQHIDGLSIQHYAYFLDGGFIGLKDPNNNPDLIIEKMKYPQGLHYLQAVIITTDGSQIYSESKEVLFNPRLSNLSFDESFDPDKKYTLTGKVDAGYVATISVINFDNQVLWSDTYTADFITKLDSTVFSGEMEFEVTYNYEEDALQMLDSGSSMLMSSSSSSSSSVGTSRIMAFEGVPDNRTAGLILCMMEDGWKDDGDNWTNTSTCRFAHKMMLNNGVYPITLAGYGKYNLVRRDIINRVFRKFPNIKYMHIYAHGNYETHKAWLLGNARRTRLLFNDGEWVAFNSRKWKDKRQAVPAGYEYLSDYYENGHYLNQIPFAPSQLKILVIESCYALRNIVTIDGDGLCHYQNGQYDWEINNHRNYSYDFGYPYSDICAGLNMTGNQSFALGGGEVIIKGPYTYYSRFFNRFWESLAGGNTAWDAWYYAKFNSGITSEVDYKHRWRGSGIYVTLSGN